VLSGVGRQTESGADNRLSRPPTRSLSAAQSLSVGQSESDGRRRRIVLPPAGELFVAHDDSAGMTALAAALAANFSRSLRLNALMGACLHDTVIRGASDRMRLTHTCGRSRPHLSPWCYAAGTAAPTCWYTAVSKPISVSTTGMSKKGRICVISTAPTPLERSSQ
jgi:hypothetical protein